MNAKENTFTRNDKVYIQTSLGESSLTNYVVIYKTIHIYDLNKLHMIH